MNRNDFITLRWELLVKYSFPQDYLLHMDIVTYLLNQILSQLTEMTLHRSFLFISIFIWTNYGVNGVKGNTAPAT